MTEADRDQGAALSTGNPDLDLVLGGGLSPGSTYVIGGRPGTGKTILAQRIAFELASPDRPARYYTTLSEPEHKLVKHLSGFSFFQGAALGRSVTFLSLQSMLQDGGGVQAVVDAISAEAVADPASVVVLDSAKALLHYGDATRRRELAYRLASRIAHTGAVLLLVGEYAEDELDDSPEGAIADGIIQLGRTSTGPTDRRWLRVQKLRGRAELQGQHTFVITTDGIAVHPRLETTAPDDIRPGTGRDLFGVDAIDRLTGGGLPSGNATVVLGPTGVGKTVLSLGLAATTSRSGGGVVYVSTEETRSELTARADALGIDLGHRVELLYAPPVSLDIDRLGGTLRQLVADHDPSLVVVDGLSTLLASARDARREASYLTALATTVRSRGASMLFTFEVAALASGMDRLSAMSYLFQNVITMRYLENDGELLRVLSVLKMRFSAHELSLLRYEIGPGGITNTGPAPRATGLMTWALSAAPHRPGAADG